MRFATSNSDSTLDSRARTNDSRASGDPSTPDSTQLIAGSTSSIVDSRPSQSAYALTDHLIHSDPIVQRFETWARASLDRGFSLDDAARAAFVDGLKEEADYFFLFLA